MAQFDLMALSSIALLALAFYQSLRSWDRKERMLSLPLLIVALLQAAWLMQFLGPWGNLDINTWAVVTAGMIACLALGLLTMDLAGYAESATLLILIIALGQLLFGSGILMWSL